MGGDGCLEPNDNVDQIIVELQNTGVSSTDTEYWRRCADVEITGRDRGKGHHSVAAGRRRESATTRGNKGHVGLGHRQRGGVENLDPDDTDPIDINLNKQVLSETLTSEFTGSLVRYHAGLAYEFDRVTLEAMFSDGWDYGSSYREGIDFEQIYLGATFKLGGS